MQSQVKQINMFEKRVFIVLVSFVLLLASFYGYFISKSIINIIVREEISRDVVDISSSISELEFKYITHKEAINMEFARSAGFKNLANKNYVTRRSLARNSLGN